MEKEAVVELLTPRPPPLFSPADSSSSSNSSSSPEFEFWNILQNPSNFPQPNLLSADQLFSDGFLLPLHLLHTSDDPPGTSGSDPHGSVPEFSAVLSSAPPPATFTSSKRWKDIFKISGSSNSERRRLVGDDKEIKKKDKKISAVAGGGAGVTAAELNINIWPFRRSRSAGNGGSRPRMAAAAAGGGATRKVSSAPCSRSNSAGESKSRKQWPSSPSRGGVHLARSTPVWQVRRGTGGGKGGGGGDLVARNAEKGVKKEVSEVRRKTQVSAVSSGGAACGGGGGAKAKVLHLNVPICIGYRSHLSCRSDENSAVRVEPEATADGGGGGSDEGVRGNTLFNIRSLFSKKVH
ncbi:hypothetical protein ACH5RR_017561 [Cinchona calisaya]|uniref:Uncharacterized protein n=1 Tax=Cinchona calisaya TaxID=153742 RepID=A0ABD2ZLV2_9GENT